MHIFLKRLLLLHLGEQMVLWLWYCCSLHSTRQVHVSSPLAGNACVTIAILYLLYYCCVPGIFLAKNQVSHVGSKAKERSLVPPHVLVGDAGLLQSVASRRRVDRDDRKPAGQEAPRCSYGTRLCISSKDGLHRFSLLDSFARPPVLFLASWPAGWLVGWQTSSQLGLFPLCAGEWLTFNLTFVGSTSSTEL